jgi:hypothetical protein
MIFAIKFCHQVRSWGKLSRAYNLNLPAFAGTCNLHLLDERAHLLFERKRLIYAKDLLPFDSQIFSGVN